MLGSLRASIFSPSRWRKQQKKLLGGELFSYNEVMLTAKDIEFLSRKTKLNPSRAQSLFEDGIITKEEANRVLRKAADENDGETTREEGEVAASLGGRALEDTSQKFGGKEQDSEDDYSF